MEPVRSWLWRRVDAPGLERGELLQTPGEWRLRGTILLRDDGRDAEARYEVRCDREWRTRACTVALRAEGQERTLSLAVRDDRWFANEQEQEHVRGCIDVDLAWTPATNTLPIRRLGLPMGASSGPVVAAWVRFPQLTLERLPQEYRRLAERRYLYSSRGGAFTAELEVDEHGLVVTYGSIWARA